MPSQSRTTDHGHPLHRPTESGPAYWGPGDSYRLGDRLVNGTAGDFLNIPDVAARYAEAAPRHGIEFLVA